MFKMNRKMEYALIALKYMSTKTPGQLTSAKEICDYYETPFDPTSRVLQIMTQNGVLSAAQGAKGGYQIIKDLSNVSTRELSDMIVGPIEITSCVRSNSSNCNFSSKCHMIGSMVKLNDRIQSLFDKISVADLIGLKSAKELAVK
ncbi:MAG TPA: Rrf2 family transcriptional regulator [Candidatus Omnitrophota bacterium]|nr:Rrf2 family transcriptional regulator [Candidatus Omnitrophota bacterium]